MKLLKLATGAVLCATLGLAADVQTVDEIVAKVNGDIVSRNELERTAKETVAELRAQNISGQRLETEFGAREKDILRNKIDSLLLVQRGKELNIDVTSELNKYLADLQRRSTIADPEKFREYVHQQTGMSWEDFQSEARNNIVTRRVIGEEVTRNVSVSAAEVQAYYEAHKKDFIREERVYLQEILVSTEGKNPAGIAAAEKKAKDLQARAARGEKFPELARDNSDSTTAQQGGDLGGYKKGDLVKTLEDAVWNLPKGGVSQPIKLPTGYLILKVTQHTKEGQAELADVQPQIEEILYEPKMEPKIRDYLTGLRKTAFLEIKDGYVDTGACPGCDTRWKDVAVLRPETTTKREVSQRVRHKRLLFLIPIPGTQQTVTGKSSSR